MEWSLPEGEFRGVISFTCKGVPSLRNTVAKLLQFVASLVLWSSENDVRVHSDVTMVDDRLGMIRSSCQPISKKMAKYCLRKDLLKGMR